MNGCRGLSETYAIIWVNWHGLTVTAKGLSVNLGCQLNGIQNHPGNRTLNMSVKEFLD